MRLKMDVHLSIDRETWKRFQELCKSLGVYPSVVIDVFCRCVLELDDIEKWEELVQVGSRVARKLNKK